MLFNVHEVSNEDYLIKKTNNICKIIESSVSIKHNYVKILAL